MLLPYLTGVNKKKVAILPNQQLIKHWAQTKKQLDFRIKSIVTKISIPVLNDLYKVCTLKQVPDFYVNFLILSSEKQPEDRLAQIFSNQITEIINQRSHFHLINSLLERRPQLIKHVESQLEIVEGFQEMNSGKTIKSSTRNKISEILKQATSLEDIKNIQQNCIRELARSVMDLRKNTRTIVQGVRNWRESLLKNVAAPSSKKNKVRIMFPKSGINCVLLPLYDQSSILNSFISNYFQLSKDNNPFLLLGKDLKKRSQFQQKFRLQLNQQETQYENLTLLILAQMPVKEDPDQKVRQQEQKQREQKLKQKQEQKINKIKQIRQKAKAAQKQKQEKQKQKEQNKKDIYSLQKVKSKQNKSIKKQSKSVIDIEGIILRHKQKISKNNDQSIEQGQNIGKPVSVQEQRSKKDGDKSDAVNKMKRAKQVINAYSNKQKPSEGNSDQKIKDIINQKAALQKQLKEAKNKNKEFQKIIKKLQKEQIPKGIKIDGNRKQDPDNKASQQRKQSKNSIEAVYKNKSRRKTKNIIDKGLDNSHISVEEILKDRKSMQKQLKEQIKQKRILQKLVKSTETEAKKQLEKKNKQKQKLQSQINLLNSRIQNKEKEEKTFQSKIEKSKVNNSNSVSIYQKRINNISPISNQHQSQLIQQKQLRLSLEKQFKQLVKEKNKLQKIIQRSESPKKKINDNNYSQINVENLFNDKKTLQKQLKDQLREKNNLEKLLKKNQNQIEKKLQKNEKEKKSLKSQIDLLKSKISFNQPEPIVNQQKLQRSKASIFSVYLSDNEGKRGNQTPSSNLYESKLLVERQQRLSLQKQMKDLIKQKTKLEKTIQKSESMMIKDKLLVDKKIQKYEQTIQKLKEQQNQLKSLKTSNAQQNTRKRAESLRMYTTNPLEQDKKPKQNELKRAVKHIQSANFFKLPPQIKKPKLRQKTIEQKQQQQPQKDDRNMKGRKSNKVEIIQTKKTIQIIYQGLKRKKKGEKGEAHQQNKTAANEEIEKVMKQKQGLLFQLERQRSRKEQEQKAQQRKAIKQSGQIQRYKEIIEKEREKKYELQSKIKNLKKQLFEQFDQKLKNQKMKFQSQKRELMQMVQNQKNQKQLKQKYLHNQIKFLKEMEANENQLLKLLQAQKKNRIQKEKQLAAQIAKKQQLLQILQIEQIKKGLEDEIRKQLESESEDEQKEEINLEQKKQELRLQIEQMNDEKNEELEEIDEQNQKLKALISRIKQQQSKLLSAIKQNINEETTSHLNQESINNQQLLIQNPYISAQLQKSRLTNRIKTQQLSDPDQNYLNLSRITEQNKSKQKAHQQQNKVNLVQTEKVFQGRLKAQENHENKMKSELESIRKSSQYQQKQQVQNLIQMYLQNPHEYPPPKNRDYSPEEKHQIKQDVLKRSKLAGDFERQLFKLKQIQKFVPTSEDDMMTSHLLNLKRFYEQKQSSALKQELFPSIKSDQNYHDKDLSFQSEQIPPKTLRDHVEMHSKNFPISKNNSKNFLSINRMRVAMLEQNRRQKQKQLIEQQAKKRAQIQSLKRALRINEQQRLRKEEQKKKKLQNRQKQLKNILNQNQKKRQPKKKRLRDTSSQSQDKNKSLQKKKQQKEQIKNLQEKKIKEERNIISEHQKQENLSEVQEKKKNQEQNMQLKDFNTQNLQITNKHSSLDKQKRSLEEDIYLYQQEIRSFVSRDQKFDIYQQFVESSEIISYVENLVSISSEQIKVLNNNHTLYKDIPTYKSLLILIAKDKIKEVEVGIAFFHKEPQQGLYVCDYMMAHNMRNFLNLLFNMSRFIFKIDKYTNKIQYYFDLSKLQDEISIIHFIEFEEKCKRMGQVYVKVGSDKTRKYVLRRNLFQPADKQFQNEGRGIQFTTILQIHSDLIRQRGIGFENKKSIQFFSSTALLANYMRKNEQVLSVFRKNAEDDLKYRQLLLTTLMLQKKEVQIKNCSTRELGMQQRLEVSRKLHNTFTIEDPTHSIREMKFYIEHFLPQKTKRCTFQIDDEQISYVIYSTEEAVTKIQSSNSSKWGIFMSVVPKYKMLIIEAQQFMNMNKVNPEINVFFYVKHFIKNISDVSKQEHPRIFIPEVSFSSEVFLKDLSDKLKMAVFARQKLKFGWSNEFNNSIIFTPSHKDLVIKRPFIMSLLSATVQRVIEGTPLFATVIS